MPDLTSKPVIVVKGLLFLLIALASAAVVLCLAPDWRIALLLAMLAWASARFYYFLFYVLEHYVDPGLKYAGIFALLRQIRRREKNVDRPE